MTRTLRRLGRPLTGLDLGSIALYRVITLVTSFGVSLFVIGVLSRTGGAGSYAAYALVASLINLLPFADLGLGASIVNVTSDHKAGLVSGDLYRATKKRALIILCLVASAMVAILVVMLISGSLESLIGVVATVDGATESVFTTLICVAISIPLGLGARTLQGLGRMRDVVQIGLVGPVFQLIATFAVVFSGGEHFFIFIVPGIAYLGVSLLHFLKARGVMRRAQYHEKLASDLLNKRSSKRVRIFQSAVPFLIISVSLSASFQSHRILLANLTTADVLAEYAAAAQFVGPLVALMSVIGQNLWSSYRVSRARGNPVNRDFLSHVFTFGLIGSIFALGFSLVTPQVVRWTSGEVIDIPMSLVYAAAGFIIVTGLHQPSAMYLTDDSGLWMQAGMTVAVAGATVVLIVITAASLGSSGPYVVLTGCMLVLQVIPSFLIARSRSLRVAETEPAEK